MTKTILTLAFTLAAISAHAADNKQTATVTNALKCETSNGKANSVVKAINALGAKPGKEEHDYTLTSPITVFGLNVTRINITPRDDENPDSYVAIFANTKLADIAAAAQLRPLAGGFVRDTKTGRLAADVRDRTDVWLTCTPTQK